MTDTTQAISDDQELSPDELDAMSRMRAKLGKKTPQANKLKARRDREHHQSALTDGRKLKATGRTVQLNIMAKPSVKADAKWLADQRDTSLTDLIESLIEEAVADAKKRSHE